MENGKVLSLYMILPDMIRAGHRMQVDDLDCDPSGIVGSRDYEDTVDFTMVLVCKKSYDIIEEAELVLGDGFLLMLTFITLKLVQLSKSVMLFLK